MSMPLPQKRSAGQSQGLLRRDSKKVKGGLNRHFERPTSNISLPLQDSIHSSMSGGSETRAWRVSALDLFSPRPKIRCSVSSAPYSTGTRISPITALEKYSTEKELEMATERKKAKRSSRIDDLADTLDAGALRQILERDQRRKEAKRKARDERMKRKLERQAEKQRAVEQRAAEAAGAPLTPHRNASAPVGLGIESQTADPMEDVRPSTPPSQSKQAQETVQEVAQLPTPMDSPSEEPVIADAKEIRYSRASMSSTPLGHVRGPSNVSELPALLSELVKAEQSEPPAPLPKESIHDFRSSGSLHPVETMNTAAPSRKDSTRRRSSETGRLAAFASLFRRGKRNSRDQVRVASSEGSFSNASRESMSRQPIPAHLVGPAPQPLTEPIQIRRPSGAPRRTMSKFREDLPETPISPPASRVQSPEVPSTSAIAARRRSRPSDLRLASASPSPDAPRTDSPVSPGVPETGIMSQSLASVDSEGSWLSGKPMKRRSNKSHMRSSVGSSYGYRKNDEFNNSYEELGIPDDEYFKRLTPQPDERRSSAQSSDHLGRKASSTAMAAITPLEEDEDVLPPVESSTSDESLVKHTVGRQPTVVYRQPRVKSTEGLLSFYQAEKSTPEEEEPPAHKESEAEILEPESPMSEGEPAVVHRAKSIDLGKHHSRQLSAGSARLLDIPARRSSVTSKRLSSSSQNAPSQQ